MQALYRTVGRKVRKRRLARGWTQKVLADLAGLHRAHLGEIERGDINVTLSTLKVLADALGVTVTDLIDGA